MRAQEAGGGCRLEKSVYTCDWQAFRARFAQAHTVTLEAQPLDRATETLLRHLVETLEKTVASPEQPGDLIFRVVPRGSDGIVFGPADEVLGSLQVFGKASDGGRGSLLWVETFTGQADRPWPSIVAALTDQFRARFKGRH